MSTHLLLYESPFGLALFEAERFTFDDADRNPSYDAVSRQVKLRAFQPFQDSTEAVEYVGAMKQGTHRRVSRVYYTTMK